MGVVILLVPVEDTFNQSNNSIYIACTECGLLDYRNQPITPFCNILQFEFFNLTNISCNIDRTAVAFCNLYQQSSDIPEEYQVSYLHNDQRLSLEYSISILVQTLTALTLLHVLEVFYFLQTTVHSILTYQ